MLFSVFSFLASFLCIVLHTYILPCCSKTSVWPLPHTVSWIIEFLQADWISNGSKTGIRPSLLTTPKVRSFYQIKYVLLQTTGKFHIKALCISWRITKSSLLASSLNRYGHFQVRSPWQLHCNTCNERADWMFQKGNNCPTTTICSWAPPRVVHIRAAIYAYIHYPTTQIHKYLVV